MSRRFATRQSRMWLWIVQMHFVLAVATSETVEAFILWLQIVVKKEFEVWGWDGSDVILDELQHVRDCSLPLTS